MMKENKKARSLGMTLHIRYCSSVLYHFAMLVYGIMVIRLYGVGDIGGINGILIILFFLLALAGLLLQAESLMKYADPLNKENRRWYTGLFIWECMEMILAYLLASGPYKGYVTISCYSVFVAVSLSVSVCIHRRIQRQYQQIKRTSEFGRLIARYEEEVLGETGADLSLCMKGFQKFLVYVILLVFVYKLTLMSWIATGVFAVANGWILWNLHWEGIRKLIPHSKLYFAVLGVCTTAGLILLKLIYDQTIVVSLFQERDAQEYLMVWILCFLPLVYYGSKVSVGYMNQTHRWVA